MKITYLSKHTITDGKWEVSVYLTESPYSLEMEDIRTSLRVILDKVYNESSAKIAETFLTECFQCNRVDVTRFFGPTLIACKEM
jgi:glutamate mutase epsilon subunit